MASALAFGFGVEASGCSVLRFIGFIGFEGLRVQGAQGCRVEGLGFRVEASRIRRI